jgi:hypothetical protein
METHYARFDLKPRHCRATETDDSGAHPPRFPAAEADEEAKRKEKTAKRGGKEAGADPSAGIMDLMRDLYEDGDEDMKRCVDTPCIPSASTLVPCDPLLPLLAARPLRSPPPRTIAKAWGESQAKQGLP